MLRSEAFYSGPVLHNCNRVYLSADGYMEVAASPNDPVFWLHDANCDRICWNWQQRYVSTISKVLEGRMSRCST